MNIVRKLSPVSPRTPRLAGEQESSLTKDVSENLACVGSKGDGGSTSSVEETDENRAQFHQDRTLTLMHLRKLFTEFSKSHHNSSEYEQKILRMLPLFAKIMAMYTPDEVPPIFKELPQFTGHVCKLFVQEVRKRASNQSTEAAAIAIAHFLEPPPSVLGAEGKGFAGFDSSCKGWLLLSGLEFLAKTGSLSVIEACCRTALPSTLAKALYLFFDLPPLVEGDQNSKERRSMLLDVFVELLTRLCSHSCAGEELARKDDLSLLFSGASSWCPQHNIRDHP